MKQKNNLETKKEELFQTSAVISKVETMVDRGLSLKIYTPELNPQDTSKLFTLKGKQGWLLFKENPIEKEDLIDLPEIKAEFSTDKTPGQRLRAVLFRLWETTSRSKTSEEFYRDYMSNLIEKIKEKL